MEIGNEERRAVLVTGAEGFIGRNLFGRLKELGFDPVSFRNSDVRGPALKEYGERRDIARYRDVKLTLAACRPDLIVHLAASGVSRSDESLERLLGVNTVGLDNLFRAAKALGLKAKFVVVGSGFEYAPQSRPIAETDPIGPWSAYGLTKAAASLVCRLYNDSFPIAIVRPFNVFGPGEGLSRLFPSTIQNTIRKQAISMTGCEQIRDFLYVDDLVSDIIDLFEILHENGTVVLNLGSGAPARLKDYLKVLETELLRAGHIPDFRVGALPYRFGEPMSHVPCLETANMLLTPRKRTPFATAIVRVMRDVQARLA